MDSPVQPTLLSILEAVQNVGRRLDEHVEAVARQFQGADKRLDGINAKFDVIDSRFDTIDSRFDAIDAKFDTIDVKFDDIDSRFDGVHVRLNEIEQLQLDTLAAVNLFSGHTDQRFDELDGHSKKTGERLDLVQATLATRVVMKDFFEAKLSTFRENASRG